MERPTAVRIVRPYVIEVAFEDGTARETDVEPFLWGAVFAPLRDPAVFTQAFVDAETGTVAWPNGADLSPELLYYGPETPYGRIEIPSPEAALSTGGVG